MGPRVLRTVNLGRNTSILFVCYFYWSLERFRLVDSTTSKYSVWNNSCGTSCAEDQLFFLPNKTELGCHNWLECDRNIQRAVIRPEYGPRPLDQIQDRRHGVADAHRAESDTATLDFMRKFVSQMQVHVPASQTVVNELCRNHSNILLDRVQHLDMWALKMFDSSAKIPSGLLSGNINQYGDFDQCLDLKTELDPPMYPHLENYRIVGKYCLATLDLDIRKSSARSAVLVEVDDLIHAHRPVISTVNDPGHRIARFSTINWGFCIPASCSADDLTLSLTESLQTALKDTAVTFRVKVDPELCYVKENLQGVSTGTKVTVVLFLSVLTLVACGTWIDASQETPKEAQTLRLIRAFSLKRNLRTLLDTESNQNDINCLNGIRSLNALSLILFHKSVALFFNPYVNRTYMAENFAKGWSVIGRTSIIYTDSFLFLSGFLTSHGLLRQLETKKKINIWSEYSSRYIRFAPNLVAVVLFCTYILTYLGSGPQWNLVVKRHSDICQRNMWRNFLFIHNYFGFEDMCLTHTHQLAVDMQLYLVAPIFIYFIWSKRWLGLGVLTLCSVYSTFLRYTVTYTKRLSPVLYFGTTLSQLYDTGRLSYTLPTHRATVYLIGIAVRLLLSETKGKVSLNKFQVAIGWTAAVTMAAVAMIGPFHMSYRNYQYSREEAALYNALSPILWSSLLGWSVFAVTSGYAGAFGRFLCWRGFTLFNRIAYSVYLTQFPIFFYNIGTTRAARSYSPNLLFEVGEVASIILASIILTLLVDLPFQEAKKILWQKDPGVVKKKHKS